MDGFVKVSCYEVKVDGFSLGDGRFGWIGWVIMGFCGLVIMCG